MDKSVKAVFCARVTIYSNTYMMFAGTGVRKYTVTHELHGTKSLSL